MAITQLGRATSLAYNDGSAQSITSIQSYSTSDNTAIEAFLMGTAQVDTHYQGKIDFEITIETADIAAYSALTVGDQVTAVVLTIEAATDSGGGASGDAVTVTLSKAVVSALGGLQHGNENSAPVVGSITFKLSRAASDSSDPTAVIAASA